jgi:hypothetical protein
MAVNGATIVTAYGLRMNEHLGVGGQIYNIGVGGSLTWGTGSYGYTATTNALGAFMNIPVSGTDATDHEVQLRIDNNAIAGFRGTGDGAGGVTDLKALLYEDTYISDSKGLVIGHNAQLTADIITEFQVLGTAAADSSAIFARFSADNNSGNIRFIKSRNATIGSHTIVVDGDQLGGIFWLPDDGVDYNTLAALFRAEVDDATPAAGDIGIAFVWHQMPGGGGALRETMRLDAAGDLNLAVGQLLIAGTQVVGARVIDARIDDAINSGDLTTDGVIDAIRDALITHGLVAAA